jgi:hypothetical protein
LAFPQASYSCRSFANAPQTIAAIHKAALSDAAISVVSGEKFAFELAVDYEFIPGVE